MKTMAFTVGNVLIHLSNIDFINEGDGTSYNPPTIILKSGTRIPIQGDYKGYSLLEAAYRVYNPED